ncbi:hypothetical protein BKA64DRAFT_686653 [Cadophora sp. MPI-SDFR-AT-0126]|nr:hypothetical protein BKA64DRAFT_686653 [Leotiomycetes sp. MPI-SDFR-AT-0126]
MPSSQRFLTPFAAIIILVLLSVVALISLDGFKKFGSARDGVKLIRRDTITFSMPWNPPLADPKPAIKAISPAAGSILDAVGKVAAALLDGGSDVANIAQGAISSLSSTALAGAPSQVPSRIQDVNSEVNQATGVVGGIVSAATEIVGSLLAGTGPSGITAAGGIERNASMGVNATAILSRTTSGLNVSSATSSMAFNITSAPVLKGPPSNSAATTCASMPTCTACPAPKTETCTVTETWHSTHYESTATLFSFVAAFTYTCTETVSVCPKSSLYPLAPPNSISSSTTPPSLIACPNGALAKRAEDCPPTSSMSITNTTNSNNSSAPTIYPDEATTTHPCPNAGYSCSECPGGVFCPPAQTTAQNCVCGYGWACGHCSQGWFCIPSPTPGSSNGLVTSAAAILGNGSTSKVMSSSVPSTMASFTANLPSQSSLPSALAAAGSGSGPFQPFPTSSGALGQAKISAGGLAGDIINSVNSALGNVNGLSGAILNSVMGQLSSVLSANFPLISSVTGAAAINNPAGVIIPTATGIVGSVAGNVLSNIPSLRGNPAAGLVPTGAAIINGVASDWTAAGIPGADNTIDGLIPAASAIIGGVNSDLLGASIPIATPGPLFQPTSTIPAINNVLPVLGKAVKEVTRTVIPQPLRSTSILASSATSIAATPSPSKDHPNVISHLTTTIRGTSTILPVVITVLSGQPTVVPLVKMVIDGKEKDMPVVGVDLTGDIGKIEAVKGVFDEETERDINDGKRSRGWSREAAGEEKEKDAVIRGGYDNL